MGEIEANTNARKRFLVAAGRRAHRLNGVIYTGGAAGMEH